MSRGERLDLARFGVAAFMTDCAFYLVMTAVPLKAISFGAGPVALGFLPAVSSTAFIVTALLSGKRSDRGGRLAIARAGTIILGAGAVALSLSRSLPQLFLLLPLIAIGGGLFWPPLQAALGDRAGTSSLETRIGWFNVAWSSGKMTGFWVAGHLAQARGTAFPLVIAACLQAALLFVAPGDRADRATHPPPSDGLKIDAGTRRRFLRAAWAANMVAFGVGATLNYQFPKRLLGLGYHAGDLGNFLGLVGLAQAATFAVLGRFGGWQYSRFWLGAPLCLGALSVAGLALAGSRAGFMAAAPGLGVMQGFAYSASLYHSVHQLEERGKNTGIHEALLGGGTFLLPLAGGLVARATDLSAPYWLCAAALIVSSSLGLLWTRTR